MSEKIIDCRNLSCPFPVIKVRDFLLENKSEQTVIVFVDNEASLENVQRFLASQAYQSVNALMQEGYWKISAEKKVVTDNKKDNINVDNVIELEKDAESNQEKQKTAEQDSVLSTVILISRDLLGSGDDLLGAKLMNNFLLTSLEMSEELSSVLLLNVGVKLACEDHICIQALKNLEEVGVNVLACGTCLDNYNLRSMLKVGKSTTMLDIVTSLQLADKVITL